MQQIIIFFKVIISIIFCSVEIKIEEDIDYTQVELLDEDLEEVWEIKDTRRENNNKSPSTSDYCIYRSNPLEDKNPFDRFAPTPSTSQSKFQPNRRKRRSGKKNNYSVSCKSSEQNITSNEKKVNEATKKKVFLEKLVDSTVLLPFKVSFSNSLESMSENINEEYIITLEIQYWTNVLNIINNYIVRIPLDGNFFFTSNKSKYNLKDKLVSNLKVLRLRVQKIFTVNDTDAEDSSNLFFTLPVIEIIENLKNELVNIKEANNIDDLKKIFEFSEKIRIYGIKNKDNCTKIQLQEILYGLEFSNIKVKLLEYKKYPIFYEFMLFTYLFADNIIDQIEEGCFLYVQFLLEILFAKLENLLKKIEIYKNITENDLSAAYKNLSYEHKIDLEIQPLKIILMNIYFGLKNGTTMFKKHVIVYLLDFTHLYMTGNKMNLYLDYEFGCIIFPLYYYIYDDSHSVHQYLYLRIGNILALLALKNYTNYQDLYLSFNRIIHHISQKGLTECLQKSILSILRNSSDFKVISPTFFTIINLFIEDIFLYIPEFDFLSSQKKYLIINLCKVITYLLRNLIYSDYHCEKMFFNYSFTDVVRQISDFTNGELFEKP